MNALLYHEKYRESHETLDFVEDTISHELLAVPLKHRDRLAQEHYVSALLHHAQETAQTLQKFYEDLDGTKSNETTTILQTAHSLDLAPFYQQLHRLRQLHHRSEDVANVSATLATPLSMVLPVQKSKYTDLDTLFSGDESFGKYLDLNGPFLLYCNLKNVPSLDYLTFIELLDKFDAIPFATKMTQDYTQYLDTVVNYLKDFMNRAKPLVNVSALISPLKDASRQDVAIETSQSALTSNIDNPLFCGPCQKLFAKDTVFQAHLTGKKHLKAIENPSNSVPSTKAASQPFTKEAKISAVNEKEAVVRALYKVLRPIKDNTIANLERKQSRTAEELLEEEDEDEWDEEQVLIDATNGTEDTDREADRLYNPLKLPLGWDGKPIPYWLYKLHGLSVSYTCEICGNYTYMGRKAFEKHFQEWRHAQGMKCLGLPNTKHFQEITTIKDAFVLAEKLKEDAKKEVFKRDTMEEFEDSEGNVFNRKTFEDLHRQGLL